jgi:N-acetylglucosamine transport system permease protein
MISSTATTIDREEADATSPSCFPAPQALAGDLANELAPIMMLRLPKTIAFHLRKSRSILLRAAVYLALSLVLVAVLYPLFWLGTASLKTDREMFSHPFALPDLHQLQWINFRRAGSVGHFDSYFINSVVVTVVTVAATTLLSAMAAYALSRFTFPGAKPIFFLLLAGLMLPLQQVIVPLFFEMRELGLLNSRLGLIIVYIALGLPFGAFVMTGFFKTQPASVYESALVDGAGEWRAFWSIMLPIARPGLITVAIFTFLGTWNEFMVAFMFLSGQGSKGLKTLPLGLANITIAGQYRSDWGMAFAGLVLIVAPTLIICLSLQRYITKGLTAGAVKG